MNESHDGLLPLICLDEGIYIISTEGFCIIANSLHKYIKTIVTLKVYKAMNSSQNGSNYLFHFA